MLKGGQKMFKKFINDNKSIEWNIFMYTVLYSLLFIIILTPIIIVGISLHPELASTLTESSSDSTEKAYSFILQIKTFTEFFIFGVISEFIRRKRSTKFTMSSLTATRILFYFCSGMLLYTFLRIGEVLVWC